VTSVDQKRACAVNRDGRGRHKKEVESNMRVRIDVFRAVVGLGLSAALTACSGMSGQVELEGEIDAGPAKGRATVTGGFGTKGKPVSHTTNPPLAAVGLCARLDVFMADGTHLAGLPVLVTGAPITQTIPAGAAHTVQSFYTWDPPAAPLSGPAGQQAGSGRNRFWIVQRPVTLELEGGENLSLMMAIQAEDIEEAARRAREVQGSVRRLLTGSSPGPRPAWLREGSFLSWRRTTDGAVDVRVGALGARFDQFRLDVNGQAGYADLGSATATTSGDWVLASAQVDASVLVVPRLRHAPAANELHAVYATDETPLNGQTCRVTLTIEDSTRKP
jgi:hypothetical protein